MTVPALAWDGFDADSADLVEVVPDRVPSKGDTVDVRNYDKDATETCLVESVARNARTVELVVRTPAGVAVADVAVRRRPIRSVLTNVIPAREGHPGERPEARCPPGRRSRPAPG